MGAGGTVLEWALRAEPAAFAEAEGWTDAETRLIPADIDARIRAHNEKATRATLRGPQTTLRDRGFYTGKIDGLYGSRTHQAIKRAAVNDRLPRKTKSVILETTEERGVPR